MVEERSGDAPLRASARSILEKVESVLPPSEQHRLQSSALFAMSSSLPEAALRNLSRLRQATAEQRKVRVTYADQATRKSERVIRPLGLYFWDNTWTVGAYCELRTDFRNFRLDRIASLKVLRDHFDLVPPVTLDDFIAAMTRDSR